MHGEANYMVINEDSDDILASTSTLEEAKEALLKEDISACYIEDKERGMRIYTEDGGDTWMTSEA